MFFYDDDKITGYHYTATGVCGYAFYSDKNKICDVSSLMVPDFPVGFLNEEISWESTYDIDSTIVPGLTRYIHDKSTGKNVAGIVYPDSGLFELADDILVVCHPRSSYSFIRDKRLIAEISPYEGSAEWLPDDYNEWEAQYDISLKKELDLRTKILILAFPMLRFV